MRTPNTFEALNELELNSLPTEDEVLEYEKHGWYVSEKILSDALLDNAVQGASEFYNGIRDISFSSSQGIAPT
uniref:hypothetical protein n=1 Tax=Roseivirga sp. TaxID=1964215 RepID=UPI0040472055